MPGRLQLVRPAFSPGTKPSAGWRQTLQALRPWLALPAASAAGSPFPSECEHRALLPSVTFAQLPVQAVISICGGLCGPHRGSVLRPLLCCFHYDNRADSKPTPQGFLFPFPPSGRQASQLKAPEPQAPGRAMEEVPTFASAPKPIICSLGLTASSWARLPLCEFPLPQKRRLLGLEAVPNTSLR